MLLVPEVHVLQEDCTFSRSRSAVLIDPSQFCHGFSNRYLCLLYLFLEYVQESGQFSFWGSVVNDVSDLCCQAD